jgi:hypothetical protein
VKRLTNAFIHGKLALAFFLTRVLLGTTSVPLIGASFVEPALLSSPPGMASILVMANASVTAVRAVDDLVGKSPMSYRSSTPRSSTEWYFILAI